MNRLSISYFVDIWWDVLHKSGTLLQVQATSRINLLSITLFKSGHSAWLLYFDGFGGYKNYGKHPINASHNKILDKTKNIKHIMFFVIASISHINMPVYYFPLSAKILIIFFTAPENVSSGRPSDAMMKFVPSIWKAA